MSGRQPNGIGNVTLAYTYADGISIVLQFNSQEYKSKVDLRAIADRIHDEVGMAVSG